MWKKVVGRLVVFGVFVLGMAIASASQAAVGF